MRKFLTVLGSVLIASLALASPGAADTASPSPSPAASSPATAVPTDANGAPVVTPDQKIDPYVRSSIVYITVRWRAWLWDKHRGAWLVKNSQGQPVDTDLSFQCTGYVVNPDGWIATAGHCVSPTVDDQAGHSIHDQYVDQATAISMSNGYWDGYTGVTKSAVHAYWEEHLRTEPQNAHTNTPDRIVTCYWGANVSGLQTDKGRVARVMKFQHFNQGDGALLKVNEPDMNALLLVPGDTSVDSGTPIAAIGYAGSVQAVTDADFHPSIKTGTVSAQKTTGDIPVYELNAQVSPGMSGGPTVNDQGQVIGTNSFGISGEPQSFNFVGTSQRILELLDSQGVANELSQDSQDLRAGLDAYFAGDKATAIAKLTSVKENQPSNDIVTAYLARAKALPTPPPPKTDSGGVPVWVWLMAVVLLLAAAVAGVLLLLRRRKPVPQPQPQPQPQPVYQMAQTAPQTAQPADGTQFAQMAPAAPLGDAPPVQPTQQQVQPLEPVGFVVRPAVETANTQPITPAVDAAGPVCVSCGESVAAGQRFCGNCGAAMY